MKMTMFKITKPKRFSFRPRYYDADREDLEMRIARVKRELDNENERGGTEELRHRLRHGWGVSHMRKADNRKSNLRIILIAGILLLIFYVLFFSDFNF